MALKRGSVRFGVILSLIFLLLGAKAYALPAGAKSGQDELLESNSEAVKALSFFNHLVDKIETKLDRQRYETFSQLFHYENEANAPENSAPPIQDRIEKYEKRLYQYQHMADNERRKALVFLWLAAGSQFENLIPPSDKAWILKAFVISAQAALPLQSAQAVFFHSTITEALPHPYRIRLEDAPELLQFLRSNVTQTGMPLSFKVPPSYWHQYKSMMNETDTVLERLLMKHGLSIYDGALWQIALVYLGKPEDRIAAEDYTKRLVTGRSGELTDIRADADPFFYGDKRKKVSRDHAFFFRIISDRYIQADPLLGFKSISGFPNFETPHHEDWKPIMGEQAWAAIIGPLQVAYVRYHGKIPIQSEEVRLALSILPTVELMQSPIGAIYHAPAGTRGKNPHDISNENNFSMYAALRMLREVMLAGHDSKTAARIERILKNQEAYFKRYAFNKADCVFYQGGFYNRSRFRHSDSLAVDCQTWAILAMGPAWIDRTYGEGTAHGMWQLTKLRSGVFDEKEILRGVGFSDSHRVLSIEWTCGAILMLREMNRYYAASHPDWVEDMNHDINTMREGVEAYKVNVDKGQKAYLYANQRYFIPFGWWANPVPSMASTAWVLMIDANLNPFKLGGGEQFKTASAKISS